MGCLANGLVGGNIHVRGVLFLAQQKRREKLKKKESLIPKEAGIRDFFS
jgi:hypothetical protein